MTSLYCPVRLPFFEQYRKLRDLHSFPTRRSSDLEKCLSCHLGDPDKYVDHEMIAAGHPDLYFEQASFEAVMPRHWKDRSEEHTSELQSRQYLVCRLLLEKKKKQNAPEHHKGPHEA